MNSSKNRIKFTRTDSHKKKRLGDKWRKPKGLQNKRRLNHRGFAPVVKKGYQSSAAEKYLIQGLLPVRIQNVAQLDEIDPKTQGIIVSGSTGLRKKLEVYTKAKEKSIKTLNGTVDDAIKRINETLQSRKESKKQLEDKKKKQAQEIKKKQEEKKKEDAKEDAKNDKAKQESSSGKDASSSSPTDDTKQVAGSKTSSTDDSQPQEDNAQKKEYDKLLTKKQ